jgi:hypothetical protein
MKCMNAIACFVLLAPFVSTGLAADDVIPVTPEYLVEHIDEWRISRRFHADDGTHTVSITRLWKEDVPRRIASEFAVKRHEDRVFRTRSHGTLDGKDATFEITVTWNDALRTTFTLTELEPDAGAEKATTYRLRIHDFLIKRYAE